MITYEEINQFANRLTKETDINEIRRFIYDLANDLNKEREFNAKLLELEYFGADFCGAGLIVRLQVPCDKHITSNMYFKRQTDVTIGGNIAGLIREY